MSTASNKKRWANPEYRARMIVLLKAARNKTEHPFDKAVRIYRIDKTRRLKAGLTK